MRNSVVIIGSGLMGAGIAAVSALAGNTTVLTDSDAAKANAGVETALRHCRELLENGLASSEAVEKAKELISASSDLNAALLRARLVIEAIFENLDAKRKLFTELDTQLPPEIPILSNTSGLRISDIAADIKHKNRAVTAHFWFPAHLVPLVEVVVGDEGSLEIACEVRDELLRWGKAAVLVKRDLPGQLANRILQAVIREAVNIVEIGLASAEDVDMAVKMGMGIRFPAWGPLEHIDAVGLDLCTSVQDTVLPHISDRKEAAPAMRDKFSAGNLGYKTGKGFYDWSVKDMETLQRKRNEFIIHALRKIRP